MKLNFSIPSLSRIGGALRPLLRHTHFAMFVLLAMLLIFGVFTVNQILLQPTDSAYLDQQQKNSVRTRFDAQTIQKIERLKSRQENPNLDLPSGQRINPFHE